MFDAVLLNVHEEEGSEIFIYKYRQMHDWLALNNIQSIISSGIILFLNFEHNEGMYTRSEKLLRLNELWVKNSNLEKLLDHLWPDFSHELQCV